MKKLFPILTLVILLLPAIQPLFTADFTCGYDNTFHLWRAVELEHLLQQGTLFSRWAPDMAHGYGYPLFNFAAPASVYPVALLRLAGVHWSWALNLTFALGWILSALTMYLFASDLYSDPLIPRIRVLPGLIAAILYAYVPFHAYDVFYRGGLSQSSAWLFPPLILWALGRANRRVGFAAAAMGFGGLILTHNAFALLFAPLLLTYTLIVGRQRGVKAMLWGILALLTGIGLSTFFWMPALAELDLVHSERLGGAWVFQYTNNFLPLEQLFAPPHTADPTLINDWPARGLGLIPALLAATGLIVTLRCNSSARNHQRRLPLAFFSGALTLCLFLILPISQPVWDALPLLQRVQFPWRLVGPAALCAAVLAGSILTTKHKTNKPTLVAAALIPLIILSNLGWFYPRHCPPPQDTSIAGMIAWERATDTLGTTAKGEYLPNWMHRFPVRLDNIDDTPIVRLPPESLPEGTHVIHANYGPTNATIELDAPAPFQARYLAFYYPGWRVTVDDKPTPITPTEPGGLISFHVPAGRHTIRVHFGETDLRLAADGFSILGLVILIVIVLKLKPQSRQSSTFSTIHYSLFIIPLFIVSLLIAPLILRRPNLVDGHLRTVDAPTEITFGDEFVLLGHNTLPDSVTSGKWFEIKTYWQALQPGGPNYGVSINLVDKNGGYHWHGPNIHPPRWSRTPPPVWDWPPDQYASIDFAIPLLPGTPPGSYTVEIVAFDRDTLIPLTAHDAAGRALGPALDLGHITVAAPRRPSNPTILDIQHRLDTPLGPLTLLGIDFDRDRAAPGDPTHITTFWRTEQQPSQDLTVHLTLLTPDGSPAAEFDLPPTITEHPTSLWQTDDIWRGQHLIHLPANLNDGDHTWNLTLLPIDQSTNLPSTLDITAPHRTFTLPPVEIEINTLLGDTTTLIGATLSLDHDKQSGVTLIWRAETETHTSYHVFLHLIGPDGILVAQSDTIPANWTRPTTSWMPGEIISDTHTLTLPDSLPAGDYVLFTGLYVPGGERLATPDGNDTIPLTTVTVEK
ncbi:MAG: hypothetical protein GY832_19475 [Chloroflexi bacterium]|nr:hypothetical protein [Chloroflexota bacterium]